MAHSPRATGAALAMLLINATTSWTWPILSELRLMVQRVAGNRNIQLHSSVISVQSASPEHIIFVHIFVPTQTNVHSFAQFVAKHSRASTIASVTKGFTLARRNLCAVVPCKVMLVGGAAADSLAQMPWVDTSDRRLGAFASNHYWTKRLPRGRRHGLKSSSRRRWLPAWLRHSP